MAGRGWRLEELAYYCFSLAGSALLLYWAMERMDPNRSAQVAAVRRKKQLEERLGRKIPTLQGLEANIASEVIDPSEIDVGLEDIGGLDHITQQLSTQIILPLRRPDLFQSHLLHQPKGVLLYGPPGTGKTMLAKALARESGANFINIRASVIQSKWFGDTHKLVAAIFSLAHKLQPAIIFIDEVDGLLGKRRDQDHEAITSLKTEFMQLWDGFLSEQQSNVMVLGATNRPKDLDDAVLRRFKLKFSVPLPDEKQRESILRVTLQRHSLESPVEEELLEDTPTKSANGEKPLRVLARQTPGFSGSDLFELCAQAAMVPVHQFIEAEDRPQQNGTVDGTVADSLDRPRVSSHQGPRPMAFRDLLKALEATKMSRDSVLDATDDKSPVDQQWAQMLLHCLLQASQRSGNGISE